MNATMSSNRYLLLAGLVTLMACNETNFSASSPIERRASVQAEALPEIEQTFSTGGYSGTETFSFSATNTLITKELKLENSYSDLTRSFTQVERAPETKLHKQGAAGMPVAETFNQGNIGIVDILVVVDDSGSMSEEQSKLAPNLSPLLKEIENSDWQINVITTSAGQPCSRGLIKKGQATAAADFSKAINAGTGGSGNEQGVARAVEGLGCQTPAWLRANSTLAVLFVSDEDNCSNGGTCDPLVVRNYVTNTLGRTVGTNARFYGIYWVPGQACVGAAFQANQYHSLVTGSNGAAGSICDANYLTTLQAISKNIASTLKSQFTLKDKPDAGSLVVKVNDAQKTTGFTVTDTTLSFTDIPPANAKIDVNYVTGREPQLKEFALGQSPAAGTLKVLVDMVEVKAGFTVNTTTNSVVFDTAPASSADIRFMFRRNMPLLKDFAMPGIDPVAGTMKVEVDGNATTDFTYDTAGKSVRLGVAPLDLAKIRVSFKNLNGPVLSYPFALAAKPQDVRAVDKTTNAPVGVVFKDDKLEVAAADHQENRLLTVLYETEESYKTQIRLNRTPIPGSVMLDVAPDSCKLGQGISVEADLVDVNCDLNDPSDFSGSFQYDLELQSSFTVQGVADTEKGVWTVSVNDEVRTDYTREGSTINFDAANLPRRGTVVVKYRFGDE